MIFGLQYALVVAGYAATAFLLGNYMLLYTGATELELGLIFAIQPAVILIRPVVCSLADRFQSHRTIYLYCSLFSFLCHWPFIVVPFLPDAPPNGEHQTRDGPLAEEARGREPGGAFVMTLRFRFWLLVFSHFIGCIFFCCMRTLGDVLTVNYCRRTKQSYTDFRRLGPISFGMCGLVLGYINCNHTLWGLPDYVPGFILYSVCHFALFVLFSLWPSEFFEIVSEAQLTGGPAAGAQLRPLPNSRQIRHHIKAKLLALITCGRAPAAPEADNRGRGLAPANKDACQQAASTPAAQRQCISSAQQARIFWLLVKQDLRIPVFMLVLVGSGVVGHSVQNFVYVYLAQVCREQQPRCHSSTISGYIMLGICLTETAAYSLASRHFHFKNEDQPGQSNEKAGRTSNNKLAKIELALVVLAGHYLVLAYATQYSAYFFLAEALHGFEFGLMIATSIEAGDYFAQEVHLIMPELRRRQIISQADDPNLVRVSLVATMLACLLLVYDGLGGVIGGLMYGLVVDRFGFPAAFQLNAALTLVLLLAVLVGTRVAGCLRVTPRIYRLAEGPAPDCELQIGAALKQ